jgi:primosomal protein N' (replication factor Y)
MKKEFTYLNIAIGLPLNDPFTYKAETETLPDDVIGRRVLVNFRNRVTVGYVVSISSSPPADTRIKTIDDFLDIKPVLSLSLIALTKWMSTYYVSSWGEAIENALPSPLKSKKKCFTRIESRVKATDEKERVPLKNITLNSEQERAFQRIQDSIEKKRAERFLLYGITGSGKTEIYIRAIQAALLKGESAICLFPEIALTQHLSELFRSHFGNDLAILHSRLTPAEKFSLWRAIYEGTKRVIIGPRSALFAPVQNLGIIVIDEVHENTYKQNETPRYHAFDAALKRAEIEGATLVGGGATPSLEIMNQAIQKRLTLLTLTKRVIDRALPDVHVIDMKHETRKGYITLISQFLRDKIESSLKQKESVLLFLNRRGFATTVSCLKCGSVVECPECKLPLTFHQSMRKLLCHYCDRKEAVPQVCPECNHAQLRFGGTGTEKVESFVARMFPTARIERLDTDRVKKKGEHERILTDFQKQKIDILIGTQMITKGFDFPNVTLVGVINADTVLTLPDFRSTERTFQLLTQVAGRAGRGEKRGIVVIQTMNPGHYAIQSAKTHDFNAFYAAEIKGRHELFYPPFSRLVNIIIRDMDEKRVTDFSQNVRDYFVARYKDMNVQVLGPAPLPFYRLHGYFRWHVMLKLDFSVPFGVEEKKGIDALLKQTSTQYMIDVDPVNIL